MIHEPRLHEDLINCTNNPLERYNRQCKEDFGRRPSVMKFIACARDHAIKYIEQMRAVDLKKLKKIERIPNIPKMPSDYETFKSTLPIRPNTRK